MKEKEFKEIYLTEEEFESIKNIFEDKEAIEDDELDEIKSLRKKSAIDSVSIGVLFIKCYNNLQNNVYLLKENPETEKKLSTFLNSFDIQQLQELVESYGGGFEWGDFFTASKIRDIVFIQRKKLNSLIDLFFKLFGEE